jgi:hypothetical protein
MMTSKLTLFAEHVQVPNLSLGDCTASMYSDQLGYVFTLRLISFQLSIPLHALIQFMVPSLWRLRAYHLGHLRENHNGLIKPKAESMPTCSDLQNTRNVRFCFRLTGDVTLSESQCMSDDIWDGRHCGKNTDRKVLGFASDPPFKSAILLCCRFTWLASFLTPGCKCRGSRPFHLNPVLKICECLMCCALLSLDNL